MYFLLQGIVQSAFLGGYMATQLLGGFLAARLGGKVCTHASEPTHRMSSEPLQPAARDLPRPLLETLIPSLPALPAGGH